MTVNTVSNALFSLILFASTHPQQAKTTALVVTTMPSIWATQDATNCANGLETCNRLLGRCIPLFDEMAERTIPCTLMSRVDKLAFEGLPLNRFALENRPQWAIDGWKECMKKTDSNLAEDSHEFGPDLRYYRAEVLHANAQIEEVLGNPTQAADQYAIASYWLHNAPDDWSMIRNQMTAAQMKPHLAAQEYVALLQALICEKPEEIEKAKEKLIWAKNKGYFDYESPSDLLSLAFISYENGDCPQAKKLLALTEKLEARGMIDLSQYVTRVDSCKRKVTLFRSGNGPIYSTSNITDNLSTVKSMLKLLQAHINQ